MNQSFTRFFLVFAIALLGIGISSVFAVDPPPFGGGSPDPIPVDGGASYLLAAGGVYAYRKLKAKRMAKAALLSAPQA
jgi:hypothetical protein